ncbi:MAG: hypothetical protein A3D67_04140 [Candidatus Lloydbacteria bacterium RIFCSPHIGHO2_02_FULL_51_22]|uniref:AFP-like domain-containing protein n=3 Tax=Candidatus Lloydiibacteriota TaxID=1817910 RepID=A0A1G2DIC5_9BACT|nr:MAG: hypothetical protein A3D67_04140 [Candidatus Lloydbacteria bacterium RIFCSPHIGHO2_02_FULL_51_22]OGZ15134.1 MAG: hypothetical protein A3J08_02625 [Candidatus Lloydbacteria bacterium RIFCSPLOWO2_02_FULL_51_11]OGZ17213.1 MAG: hypothetical protein A3G11_02155 [Candidatus Lloydbacteria bacterium RIFCSPLOWO2_12_FULL_51_9]
MAQRLREQREKFLGGNKVFVIAEIGKNFIQTEEEKSVAEYLANAKKLVDAAKNAGCDAVKFQTHEVEDEVLDIEFTSPHFKSKDRYSWVTRNMNATPLETFWKPIKAHCDKRGIIFFSTPMSRKAAQKLDKVGVPFWKVGSGDIFDYVLLDYLTDTGKPIIFSTGMASLNELDRVVSHLSEKKTPLVVLYCISKYPAPKEYFNLATIEYLKEKYPAVTIGFSDHSLGHDVALAAVALGARVVEKHFSFSRDLWGADHKVSMTPAEMKEFARLVHTRTYKDVPVDAYYGKKEKELEGAGNQFRPYFHKSLMAGENLAKGAVITKNVVFAMRPQKLAEGLSSDCFYDVVGCKTKRALKKFDPITKDVIARATC